MPVDVKYLRVVGNHIYARGTNDTDNVFVNTVGDFFLPGALTDTPPSGTPSGGTQADVVAWCVSRIGLFAYCSGCGDTARLNPDVSGTTDCSGLVYRAYLDVTGLNIGTWTGTQYYTGTNIVAGSATLDESLLVNGDLVFYDWGSNGQTTTFDHVEMYMGSNTTIGHGGNPYMGPAEKSLSANIGFALRYRVQRYI